MAKEPKGLDEFDRLARKLVAVPKAQVDKAVAADRAARLKAKRKKK